MLVANGLGVYKFIQAPTDPDTLQEAQKKLFFLLANTMLTSMSKKAWQIATGGGLIQDLAPYEMLKWLENHFLPVTTANDIQLRRQLYTMKLTNGKSIEAFANEIRTLVNQINAVEVMWAKANGNQPSLIGERDIIAVLIMDLPNDYNPEVTLIEHELDVKFKRAVETLRAQELHNKI